MTSGDHPEHDPRSTDPRALSPAGPAPDNARETTPPATSAPDGFADIADFLAEAAARKAATTPATGAAPADWSDPDPAAIQNLRPGTDPVTAALRRRKEGTSRQGFAGGIRRACERLQGLQVGSLTLEQATIFPWHHLTEEMLEDYVAAVKKHHPSQASRNDAVCAVRAVLTQCHSRGLISTYRRDLLFDVLLTSTPGRSTRRRRLALDEISRLLRTAATLGSPAARARNVAIFALLSTSGIRGIELVRAQLHDWDRTEDTLLLRDTKNARPHSVHLHPEVVPLLEAWLALRGTRPGALFPALTTGGAIANTESLTTSSLRTMVYTRTAAAEVPHFTVHDFRRTFATTLLRTHDPALVSKLLNHTKLDSTLIYDLADDDEMREAVRTLHLPTLAALQDTNEDATTPPEDGDDGDDDATAGDPTSPDEPDEPDQAGTHGRDGGSAA